MSLEVIILMNCILKNKKINETLNVDFMLLKKIILYIFYSMYMQTFIKI